MKYFFSDITNTGLATMDNNAKSCYDRIIVNLAMIISQYFGVKSSAAKMQATTLRKMQFRLHTSLGDSERYYCHSKETPVHGTGQGSCASPCIWLLISSILMDCLQELAGGMKMTNPGNTIMIQQWIDGFVDDMSLFSNLLGANENTNDIKMLHEKLSIDLTAWKELLEAYGGKLELEKCFYYTLNWKFNKLGDAIPTMIEEQRAICPQITVKDTTTNSEITIQQKETMEEHQTLGCKKTMIHNNAGQKTKLKKQSFDTGIKVKNSTFTRKQGWMALNGSYIPSIRYSLSATSLTKDEIDEIQKFTIDKFLSKIGYDHSTHRSIVFGPKELGGLGLCHLFTEMMEMKIQTVMSHIRAKSRLGQAFRINIEQLQLVAGQSAPIMESKSPITYIKPNWLLHLRDYLITINANMQINDLWQIGKLRHNDIVLMDAVITCGATPRELKTFNNWRIFFKTTCLSEICNAEGTKIANQYLKYPTDNFDHQSTTKLLWPQQERLGKKSFKTWVKVLQLTFDINGQNLLPSPLGPWKMNKLAKSKIEWLAYYDIENNLAAIPEGNNKYKQ
jgi:hypothetical protein